MNRLAKAVQILGHRFYQLSLYKINRDLMLYRTLNLEQILELKENVIIYMFFLHNLGNSVIVIFCTFVIKLDK